MSASSTRPLRVAHYARCSTAEQRVDLQLDALRQLSSQRGWEIANEFVDHGWSGTSSKRPQLAAMLAEIGRGRIDCVSVFRLDRLGRSTRDLLNLLEDFRIRNVQLVSAQENIDTATPMGRVFVTLVAMLSEAEAGWLRERTIHGLRAAVRRGAILGRPRVTVDLVRAHELLRGGQSVRQTARAMGVGASTLSRALRAEGPSTSIALVQPDAA
jgi:DNA invertase Pin-like site-specific DNA recombinase